MGRSLILLLTLVLLNSLKAASQLLLRAPAPIVEKKISLTVLPQNFYNRTLGFACKKEILMQQAVRMPLFLRLGSLDEVNRLEGKGNMHGRNALRFPANREYRDQQNPAGMNYTEKLFTRR